MTERPTNGSCAEIKDFQTIDAYWFPKNYLSPEARMAKRICLGCEALHQCQDYSLDEMPAYGIYGGLTPGDRLDIMYGGDAA